MSDNSILCYGVTVSKQLQTEILTRALKHLVLYNEMLQVRLEHGRYIPEPEAPDRLGAQLLSIHDSAGKSPADVEILFGQAITTIAAQMGCEFGASIRLVVFDIDRDFNKLFLLSHRMIIDNRGLVLILEDLYRIYEQLLNGKKVALRPVGKTYTEFINEVMVAEMTKSRDPFGGQFTNGAGEILIPDAGHETERVQQKTAAFSMFFDKRLRRRLFSRRVAESDLRPEEAIAGALLRIVLRQSDEYPLSIWIKNDFRITDERLKYTVGALTRTYPLPATWAKSQGGLSDPRNLKGILRDLSLHSLAPDSSMPSFPTCANAVPRLLLNLEYLTDEPWLGGDEWLPEGFVITGRGRVGRNYLMEITPFLSGEGIEIIVEYKETPVTKTLTDNLTAHLVTELESVLRYWEGYADAREFWAREFATAVAQSKIEVEIDDLPVAERGRAPSVCQVDKNSVGRALHDIDADASQLFLAIYTILISRLKGSEDLVLLCALDADAMDTVFPLRLNPASTHSFRFFIEQVKSKLRRAVEWGRYAFDILSEEQSKRCRSDLVLDVGYIYKQKSVTKSFQLSTDDWKTDYPSLNQDPELTMVTYEHDVAFNINFIYETNRYGAELISGLGLYLNKILETVAANPDITLEEIELGRYPKVDEIASQLARDSFNF